MSNCCLGAEGCNFVITGKAIPSSAVKRTYTTRNVPKVVVWVEQETCMGDLVHRKSDCGIKKIKDTDRGAASLHFV